MRRKKQSITGENERHRKMGRMPANPFFSDVRHAEPATKSPLRKSTAAPNAENAGQYLKQKNCFYPSR